MAAFCDQYQRLINVGSTLVLCHVVEQTQHVLFIALHYMYVKVTSRLEVLYKTYFKHYEHRRLVG